MKIVSLLIFLISFSSYAFGNTKCRGFYFDRGSIDFGILFQRARDKQILDELNKISKAQLFTGENGDSDMMLNHMIDTLLYYRALQELAGNHHVPVEFDGFDAKEFFEAIQLEAQGKNAKFNFFKQYIQNGL